MMKSKILVSRLSGLMFITLPLVLIFAHAEAQLDSIAIRPREKVILKGKLSVILHPGSNRISMSKLRAFRPEVKVMAQAGFSFPDRSKVLYYELDMNWPVNEEGRLDLWRFAFETASTLPSFEFLAHGFVESLNNKPQFYYMSCRAIVDGEQVTSKLSFRQLNNKILYTLNTSSIYNPGLSNNSLDY